MESSGMVVDTTNFLTNMLQAKRLRFTINCDLIIK